VRLRLVGWKITHTIKVPDRKLRAHAGLARTGQAQNANFVDGRRHARQRAGFARELQQQGVKYPLLAKQGRPKKLHVSFFYSRNKFLPKDKARGACTVPV
jgi:hypothetical protein